MHNQHKLFLKNSISIVVEMEQSMEPVWHEIEGIIDEIWQYIVKHKLDGELDREIIKYLDDADIRKRDKSYGDYQRNFLLNTSIKSLKG